MNRPQTYPLFAHRVVSITMTLASNYNGSCFRGWMLT